MRPLLAIATVSLSAVLIGCGSDDGAGGEPVASEPATTATDLYCGKVAEYVDATSNFDVSSVRSMQDSFAAGATSARALADSAPAEVREAASKLASAAEELSAGLVAAAPANRDQFETVAAELTDELQGSYGDLVAETVLLSAHAEETCGIKI